MSFELKSGRSSPAVGTGAVGRSRRLIVTWAVCAVLLLFCLPAAQANEPFKRYGGYQTLEEFIQALEQLNEHEYEFLWGSVLAEKLRWVGHAPAAGEAPIATRAYEMFPRVKNNHTRIALVDLMFDLDNKEESWRRIARIATDTTLHWSVRNQAIGYLASDVGEKSRLVCESLLVDADGEVRFKAAQTLWDYGKPAWPMLALGMRTSDVEYRRGVVAGLSLKGANKVVGEQGICTRQELLDALIAMYEVEEDSRVLQYLPDLIFELEPHSAKRAEIIEKRSKSKRNNFHAVYYGLLELWTVPVEIGKDSPEETEEMRQFRMHIAIVRAGLPRAFARTLFLIDLPSTDSYSAFLAAVRVLSSPLVRKQNALLKSAGFPSITTEYLWRLHDRYGRMATSPEWRKHHEELRVGRLEMLHVLASLKEKETIPLMKTALVSESVPDPLARWFCYLLAMMDRSEETVALMRDVATGTKQAAPPVRCGAMAYLALVLKANCVDELCAILTTDKDAAIRKEAAWLLGELCYYLVLDDVVLPALNKALEKEKDETVRTAVSRSLARIRCAPPDPEQRKKQAADLLKTLNMPE